MGWIESYIRVDNELLDDEEFQKRTSRMRHLCFVGMKKAGLKNEIIKVHKYFGVLGYISCPRS